MCRALLKVLKVSHILLKWISSTFIIIDDVKEGDMGGRMVSRSPLHVSAISSPNLRTARYGRAYYALSSIP